MEKQSHDVGQNCKAGKSYLILENVVPNIGTHFSDSLALMLGKPLLWAVFSNLKRDNEVTEFERNQIIMVYERVEYDIRDSNRVKRIGDRKQWSVVHG